MKKNEGYFIFEDDSVPVYKDYDYSKIINEALENNVDLLYLSYIQMNPDNTKISKNIEKVNCMTFSTDAYYITKSGAKKLYERVLPISSQIDSYISMSGMYYDVNVYKTKEQLFYQYTHLSSIQTDGIYFLTHSILYQYMFPRVKNFY